MTPSAEEDAIATEYAVRWDDGSIEPVIDRTAAHALVNRHPAWSGEIVHRRAICGEWTHVTPPTPDDPNPPARVGGE